MAFATLHPNLELSEKVMAWVALLGSPLAADHKNEPTNAAAWRSSCREMQIGKKPQSTGYFKTTQFFFCQSITYILTCEIMNGLHERFEVRLKFNLSETRLQMNSWVWTNCVMIVVSSIKLFESLPTLFWNYKSLALKMLQCDS